jgi:hypothetical protein
MSDVVQSLRQALQDIVAPELREHRVLLTALDGKIDSRTAALDSKIDSRTAELRSEIGGLRLAMETGFAKVDTGFQVLKQALDAAVLRGEISTVRELAELRSRVERIEQVLRLRQDETGLQKQ